MTYSFALHSSSAASAAVRAAEETGDPWEALAMAIVAQAALDYQALYAYDVLRRQRNPMQPYQGTLGELEIFFRSKWFAALTGLDGEYLQRLLRERVEREVLK